MTQDKDKAAQAPQASKYIVPEGEEGYVHAKIVRAEFDTATGQPKFKPNLQKWNPLEWQNFLRYPHGFTVQEILHIPAGVPRTLAAIQAKEKKAKEGTE